MTMTAETGETATVMIEIAAGIEAETATGIEMTETEGIATAMTDETTDETTVKMPLHTTLFSRCSRIHAVVHGATIKIGGTATTTATTTGKETEQAVDLDNPSGRSRL